MLCCFEFAFFSDFQPHYKTRHTPLVRSCFLQLTPSTTNHTSHLLIDYQLPNPIHVCFLQLARHTTSVSFNYHIPHYYLLSVNRTISAYTPVPFNHSTPLQIQYTAPSFPSTNTRHNKATYNTFAVSFNLPPTLVNNLTNPFPSTLSPHGEMFKEQIERTRA
jgi:hypothetical protein